MKPWLGAGKDHTEPTVSWEGGLRGVRREAAAALGVWGRRTPPLSGIRMSLNGSPQSHSRPLSKVTLTRSPRSPPRPRGGAEAPDEAWGTAWSPLTVRSVGRTGDL